jgi:hypothetical protein
MPDFCKSVTHVDFTDELRESFAVSYASLVYLGQLYLADFLLAWMTMICYSNHSPKSKGYSRFQ